MLRLSQIKLHISHNPEDLRNAIIKKLRIPPRGLLDFIIVKKSLDARDKTKICYLYTVDVSTDRDDYILKHNRNSHITKAERVSYRYPEKGNIPLKHRPVVIGSGPSGLFAAYFLAKEGFCPLIIERGQPVEERIETVRKFWESGVLDPSCNMQFGEGGAGTFSDGKLNSGVHDVSGRRTLVFRTFCEHGAPEEILYANKPHLGTDQLVSIISGMRKRIIEWGGEYRFGSCFREFLTENGQVKAIRTDTETIPCEVVILAIGHSARDTFRYLIRHPEIQTQAKAFAVGVRAEHLQKDINAAQYGEEAARILPPADYKLTCKTAGGSSVYSFCMCPGGFVVNSSSSNGFTCINGMSYSARDTENANAAIVVAVKPSDDPEENILWQEELEKKAFQIGKGKIISQRFEDFENHRVTAQFGKVLPVHKGATVLEDINRVLPDGLCRDIREAMHIFGKKIRGFDDPDVILSAPETRTSSPVRIVRGETLETAVHGIFPVGEGAGYAGGITSAAIDGIRAFEQVYSRFVFSASLC